MTYIPKEVDINLVSSLERINQGKVRDTYLLPDYPNLLLQVATDRVSIFDFVLSKFVPGKGIELTKQTIFWLTVVLKDLPNHLVIHGQGIDKFLPANLRNNPDLQARAIVVEKLKMVPIESIVRGYLTGTGLTKYLETGMVCGHILPDGLHDGSQLPIPIYTPTTKATSGHDEHIDYQTVREEYGTHQEFFSLVVFYMISNYAKMKGIILADTKFEFGYDEYGVLRLGDEIGTGDSSREWKMEEWVNAQEQKKAPSGYDKEPLRQWGKTLNIHKMTPKNPEHVQIVSNIEVPDREIMATSFRYRELSKMLIP